MKAKDFFGKILSLKLWLNFAAMLLTVILICTGVKFGLDIYTHHGEEIKIPDVKNMSAADAEHLLKSLKLKMAVSDTGYVKTLPAGCVLEQTPDAGRKVKADRVIYVVINSASSPTLAIPDVIDNCSYREARAKLTAMGFKVGPTEFIPGEKDWLYGLKSKGRMLHNGQRVAVTDVVVMQVGDGMRDADASVMFVDADDYGGTAADSLYRGDHEYGGDYDKGNARADVDEFEVVTGPE